MYTLETGDCLEFLRRLHDGAADLAWVDPPYNVGKDYGAYKDNMPVPEYLEWCACWMVELQRVARAVAVYPPKIHLRRFWEMVPENHLVICGWSPVGAIRGHYIHQYAPLLLPPRPNKRIPDHWWNPQLPGLGYFFKEDRFDHSGQTSLDITRRVINAFCPEGGTVIDCFAGVGTTGVVCAQTQRRFMGSELNPEYALVARRRIEEAAAQLPLFT